jgi:hypothetical protein
MNLFLQPVIDALVALTSPVSEKYFPYPWAATLHAMRISLVYQSNVRAQDPTNKPGWGAYITGYLLMVSLLPISLPQTKRKCRLGQDHCTRTPCSHSPRRTSIRSAHTSIT